MAGVQLTYSPILGQNPAYALPRFRFPVVLAPSDGERLASNPSQGTTRSPPPTDLGQPDIGDSHAAGGMDHDTRRVSEVEVL
jgi:hypothetical protein